MKEFEVNQHKEANSFPIEPLSVILLLFKILITQSMIVNIDFKISKSESEGVVEDDDNDGHLPKMSKSEFELELEDVEDEQEYKQDPDDDDNDDRPKTSTLISKKSQSLKSKPSSMKDSKKDKKEAGADLKKRTLWTHDATLMLMVGVEQYGVGESKKIHEKYKSLTFILNTLT
jgi:hypothetical protein